MEETTRIFVPGKPDVTETMYCVKCQTMVVVTGPQVMTMKSNRDALHGPCPHCKTMVYKIIKISRPQA